MLGAAVGLALGLGAGAAHSRTTTVIESAPATASVAGSARGSWKAVYARAAAGTIDLTVQSTTIVNTRFGEREQQATALGSGFVLDGQGHLLIAAHVVDGGPRSVSDFRTGARAAQRSSARTTLPTSQSCMSTPPT